ncbi:Methyltransferase-like protein 6 [Balamuthia mandrillaris]
MQAKDGFRSSWQPPPGFVYAPYTSPTSVLNRSKSKNMSEMLVATGIDFIDRHWLLREFPPLRPTEHVNLGTPPTVVLEVGCGVGNTVFPLLEDNPHLFVYAVDFSPYAIELLKANAQYNEQHCNGFVCDASDSNSWPSQIAEASVDIVLLIFVLSAMSPEKMELALKNIHKVVKPGGIVCFRDYARGDLAQQRFEKDIENKLGENFHVRGDGTRAYYFTKAQAKSLFEKAGFMVDWWIKVE